MPCPPVLSSGSGCAGHFSAASNVSATALETVVVVNIKNTSAQALTSWADYYLLLGADHLIVIDTNCDEADIAMTEAVLTPYVERGFMTLIMAYRCMSFNSSFDATTLRPHALARSPIASRLQPQTIIFEMDDDEYLVLGSAAATLLDVAKSFRAQNTCITQVAWRVFGSDGHSCQPPSILAGFTRRAPLLVEMKKETIIKMAVAEATRNHLSQPFSKGKAVTTWDQLVRCRTKVGGYSHFCPLPCRSTYYHSASKINGRQHSSQQLSCGSSKAWDDDPVKRWKLLRRASTNSSISPQAAVILELMSPLGARCATLNGVTGLYSGRAPGLADGGIWINHYAFQSEERWKTKKLRGRTNLQKKRSGEISPFYSTIVDTNGHRILSKRIQQLSDPSLRRCLSTAFEVAEPKAVS